MRVFNLNSIYATKRLLAHIDEHLWSLQGAEIIFISVQGFFFACCFLRFIDISTFFNPDWFRTVYKRIPSGCQLEREREKWEKSQICFYFCERWVVMSKVWTQSHMEAITFLELMHQDATNKNQCLGEKRGKKKTTRTGKGVCAADWCEENSAAILMRGSTLVYVFERYETHTHTHFTPAPL